MSQKATNDQIINSYKRTGSIWTSGKELGMCGQSVWERLIKMNLINEKRVYSGIRKFKDYDVLKEKYLIYRDRGDLELLAKELERTKQFICRKAKEIGLTKIAYIKTKSQLEKIGIGRSLAHKKYGHPRGMLGKKHSAETSKKMSITRKKIWANYSDEEKVRRTRVQLDAKLKKYGTITNSNRKSTWRQGWKTINNVKYYFRSSWEYHYANFLQIQKQEGKIINWRYEPKTFTFDKEKLKVTYYTPDFEIITIRNEIEYHEVKGWIDERSILKSKLMTKWYPEVKIITIGSKWFLSKKSLKKLIIQWESA